MSQASGQSARRWAFRWRWIVSLGVSYKPVAAAAGLGHMGLRRNVIHPRFANFILLGTVLLDAEVSAHMKPIDYNPCLSFGANYKAAYCMAVCPAGDDVIGPFLTDRETSLQDVACPLQDKPETGYVVSNMNAVDAPDGFGRGGV